MEEMIRKIVELKKTCDGFPTQWEGKTKSGALYYFRFRWGTLTCQRIITLNGKEIWSNPLISVEFAEAYSGILNLKDLRKLIKKKFILPKNEC